MKKAVMLILVTVLHFTGSDMWWFLQKSIVKVDVVTVGFAQSSFLSYVSCVIEYTNEKPNTCKVRVTNTDEVPRRQWMYGEQGRCSG